MRIGITLAALAAAVAGTWLGVMTRQNRLVWDHFDEVKPGILYRSGQLNPDQLDAAIRRYGIRTVVNFQRTSPQVTRERLQTKRLGVDFLNLPMTGDGFGREEQFREVLKACDDPDRRPVLVHCARGTCRTGAATALYRFERDGWTIDDVSNEMRRQSYKDGWLPGYVYEMVHDRPSDLFADPPVTLDKNLPAPPPRPANPEGVDEHGHRVEATAALPVIDAGSTAPR